ncbi:photosystem II oxygen evolving complex protein PsbP [[Leptolyngbya] sp. PCC 7376]|uniref:photosystem II reaction center PsbP n=1 Tax=[Leptolyngbya] sp. PCC 7376 TaxID=111781 RepID=UPI00029F3D9C|nr:photosystem II reaction center PsbP [[Leptolyngbya] sp. PCC 7376]AFY37164.1 photosystem II oxygen evolving complex protein PsbP [[Leptolyngbya] sp. PCC 7376]
MLVARLRQIGKQAIAAVLVLCCSLGLIACGDGIGSLQSYSSETYGYEFLYPNGWIPVNVENAKTGVDVVFRDLIEYSENLSVIISDVPVEKNLTDLGSPTDVGYRFMQEASQNSDRQPELIRAEERSDDAGQTYYILEYQVALPNGQIRHDLATVAVKFGKLYSFNLSTLQERWDDVDGLFNTIIKSFKL